jgi:uncharacterized protein (TIGR02646 family)
VIKIDRHKIAKPEFFHSKEYERLQQEISEFYKLHKSSRAQRTYSVNYFPKEVINHLMELFDYKCAYCESQLMATKMGYESYLNHFRPSNNSQGFDSKEIDADHYWWLTYQWENVYACCNNCSRHKSNLFPVQGKRAAIETVHEAISEKENAFLIDPCVDDPSQFFTFNFDTFEIYSLNENALSLSQKVKFSPLIGEMVRQKAEATIQIIGLNRKDLIYARQTIANETKREAEGLRKGIKNSRAIAEEWNEILKGTSKKDHLAFRKALIDHYLDDKEIYSKLSGLTDQIQSYYNQVKQQQLPSQSPFSQEKIKGGDNLFESESYNYENKEVDIRPSTSRERNPKKKDSKVNKLVFQKKEESLYTSILKNIYLDKIVLKNFKCFSDLTLELPDYSEDTSSEPWLVFLGENGVGKSSVLKAIALALMGQTYLDTLDLTVNDLLKYGKRSGFIHVYGKGNDEFFEITFNKKDNKIVANIEKPPAFIIGYGSTRLLPIGNLQPEKDHPNYLKVKNLFDASISLSNAKEWLLNTDRKTFNQVAKTLKNLLMLDDLDAIQRSIKNEQIFIKYEKTKDNIDINHLSDGYKSIFAIAIDMVYTLSKENVVYELAEGIVLIDEIGTHLHPRWKMEIVERLRKTFPKIQFIITTHEPLCLRGLKENEIVVLKHDSENAIIAISDLPDPSSLRIDQLLTSEYFGLNSTMDSKTEKEFERYYELLAIEELNRTTADKEEILEFQKTLPQKKRLGNDAREDLMYHAIDELLAKKMKNKKLKIVDEYIKKETINKVQDIWKAISAKNKL